MLVRAIVLFVILFFSSLVGPAAKQVREKEASQTTAAQDAAPDQETSEAVLVRAIVLFVILFFSSLIGPAAKQVREKEASQTAAAQQAAPD